MREQRRGTVAAVAAGGVLGALARYGVGTLWPGNPWATLLVNAVGCLAMGCLVVLVVDAHPLVRPFLGTGVLGGFTTFSAYCADTQHLFATGHAVQALAYLVATVVAALAAVTLGVVLTRRLR
ncbi:CrcB family protein [Actinokineospora sp. NBRC 105648]|uniref:fluoride efflux transporter FluC n=1 Tax=Actinokineospora sp. NBRC 105648 TaxID=3032206 RepID=UPI0025555C27|nr:CrcB family protein [Actinokineospora sp. NBRC 105648]